MTTETKQLGNSGEQIAAEYLKKQGYKILDRNFRYKGFGEIDIIAQNKNKDTVFVEVKTRLRQGFGGQARENTANNTNNTYMPEDNITYFKQKQLIKLAKIYLINKKIPQDISWQIDVIAVEIDPISKKTDLRHIEKAIEDIY